MTLMPPLLRLPRRTTTHCNTLQYAATRCNALQRTTTCMALMPPLFQLPRHTTTHCNSLQHTATHCNTYNTDATTTPATKANYNTLHHTATQHILQRPRERVEKSLRRPKIKVFDILPLHLVAGAKIFLNLFLRAVLFFPDNCVWLPWSTVFFGVICACIQALLPMCRGLLWMYGLFCGCIGLFCGCIGLF